VRSPKKAIPLVNGALYLRTKGYWLAKRGNGEEKDRGEKALSFPAEKKVTHAFNLAFRRGRSENRRRRKKRDSLAGGGGEV